MLKRKAYDEMLSWSRTQRRADRGRKALLVTGARQIGKSFLVRHLGLSEYASFVEINLLEDERAKEILSEAVDTVDFINRVALLSSDQLVEGNTLVFIDEIQEEPDVMTFAKFLVEDGRYDYAFSGSMLGTEFKGVRSFPVGFVTELEMRPMDFEEFCWAIGTSETAIDEVRDAFRRRKPVADYIHDAMLGNFRAYVVVGGMPEVVQRFVDAGGSVAETRSLQTALNAQYSYDISKYVGSRALQVKAVFDELPLQLEDDKAKFEVSSLGKTARYNSYEKDFVWLVNAGVALKANKVTEPKPPLRRTQKPSSFRLYQSDTGMLLARYPQSLARAVYVDNRKANVGGVFENVIAQELVAAGFTPFYFHARKVGEVDFLVEGNRGVVALEVKSGNDYLTHASLAKVMKTEGYDVSLPVVLCRSNVKERDGVLYLPWYMSLCFASWMGEEDFAIKLTRV